MLIDSTAPFRALVIEDNPDLAHLFSDILEVLGCSTDVAWNAEKGVKTALASRPQVIFCDLSMPGNTDGFGAAEEIRASASLANVRLIAVTGHSAPEYRARALQAGFDDILVKPIKFAQIQALVNEMRNAAA